VHKNRKRIAALAIAISSSFAFTVLNFGAGAANAQPKHAATSGPACSGVGNGMSHDYEITGTNFTAGRVYVIAITPPNAPTFYAPTPADSTGSWGEYWLPDSTGTYTAKVFTYASGTLGQFVTSCGSLTVS
jgi:hypothetical protein